MARLFVAVEQVEQRAEEQLRGGALPEVAGTADVEGDVQGLERALEGEAGRAGAVEDGDLLGRHAVPDQRHDGPHHLPDLDVGRGIAADRDRSGAIRRRLVVLGEAVAVPADQPLRPGHDLGRRAIVAVEQVEHRVAGAGA